VVLRRQQRLVRDDPRPPNAPGHGDAGQTVVADRQSPQRGCAVVAEHRVGTAGQDGRHPPRFPRGRSVADRVHTRVQTMQPPCGDLAVDPRGMPTLGGQLRTPDDAVLASDPSLDRRFSSHIDEK
jgi:hypothetical protein